MAHNLNTCSYAPLQAFTLELKRPRLHALRQSLTADILVSVGFRPGAPTWRGRAFDALWSLLRLLNPHAVRVFYWLGTDVLHATQDFNTGRLQKGPHRRAMQDEHLADATWLVEELQALGIHALHKTVTSADLLVDVVPDLPSTFSVLTYIPDGRYRFYGGQTLFKAAQQLPHIRFDVVGGSGSWIPHPLPNLNFHGWQSDMKSFHHRASVFVRLVEHDGTGLTVLEALSLGRHVIYSHPLPFTLQAACDDSSKLTETLSTLFNLHQQGLLPPNIAGSAYVQEHFNHDVCLQDLVQHLIQLASSPHRQSTTHRGEFTS